MLIIFGERDDKCIARLLDRLRITTEVTFLPLGCDGNQVDVDSDLKDFRIAIGDAIVTTRDLLTAPLIVYRRCWHNETPLVKPNEDEEEEDRLFAQKEWDAAIRGALLAAESASSAVWMNSPKLELVSRNKIFLLSVAARCGFTVPRTRISSTSRLPPGVSNAVCKAINVDERISESRYFPTTLVTQDLADILNKPLLCPSLLQEYVRSDIELRLYFVLGETITLRISKSVDTPIDSRYLARHQMTVERIACPSDILALTRHFAELTGLRFFALDLILTNSDAYLLDVTPNATWSFYEDVDHDMVTAPMAAALVKAVR
jgi:glutathione synthase/RimK-type ligase-like ATP-grasp enzyme